MKFKQIANGKKKMFLQNADRYCRYISTIKDPHFNPQDIADAVYLQMGPQQKDSMLKDLLANDVKIMNSKFQKSGLFQRSFKKDKSSAIGPHLSELYIICENKKSVRQVPIEMCNFATGEVDLMKMADDYYSHNDFGKSGKLLSDFSDFEPMEII